MSDIELVIKIPEEYYKAIMKIPANQSTADMLIIKNGTPLPKGHGRIIDETQINKCGWNFINHHAKTNAPTIIEADKESEE